jgi:hypothetical protein
MPSADQDGIGRGPLIVLALFALVVLAFAKSAPLSWSDASRMGSIQALVEYGSLALDETDYFHQGDKVRVGGPRASGGHYYSHQPPMLALLAAVPYGLLHTFGREIDSPGTYRLITIVVVGLPLLLGFVSLARLMRLAGASSEQVTWFLTAAAFGSLALPYALVLNQHGAAAGLVMCALLQMQRRRYVHVGVLLSLAVTIDFTAVFFALAMLLPMARAGGLRAILTYGCAALPLLLLHFGINYAMVGDLKPLSLHSEAFEYPMSPFMLMSLTGILDEGTSRSLAAYSYGALFGASGLFSHHPVLLFAVGMGVAALIEEGLRRARGERDPARLTPSLDHSVLLASIGICLYYILESDNYGGGAFGMRWFCVFAPSLMLLCAVWLGRKSERRLRPAFFLPLLLWSVGAAGLGAAQPWLKIEYRWQDSERGKRALSRGETLDPLDHWAGQLRRMGALDPVWTEERLAGLHMELINKHRIAYLPRLPEESDEEYRARLEIGLAKLERAVAILDEEESPSLSRPWGHYWLAEFYRRLGRVDEARREVKTTLALSQNFEETPFFVKWRKAERDEGEGPGKDE